MRACGQSATDTTVVVVILLSRRHDRGGEPRGGVEVVEDVRVVKDSFKTPEAIHRLIPHGPIDSDRSGCRGVGLNDPLAAPETETVDVA